MTQSDTKNFKYKFSEQPQKLEERDQSDQNRNRQILLELSEQSQQMYLEQKNNQLWDSIMSQHELNLSQKKPLNIFSQKQEDINNIFKFDNETSDYEEEKIFDPLDISKIYSQQQNQMNQSYQSENSLFKQFIPQQTIQQSSRKLLPQQTEEINIVTSQQDYLEASQSVELKNLLIVPENPMTQSKLQTQQEVDIKDTTDVSTEQHQKPRKNSSNVAKNSTIKEKSSSQNKLKKQQSTVQVNKDKKIQEQSTSQHVVQQSDKHEYSKTQKQEKKQTVKDNSSAEIYIKQVQQNKEKQQQLSIQGQSNLTSKQTKKQLKKLQHQKEQQMLLEQQRLKQQQKQAQAEENHKNYEEHHQVQNQTKSLLSYYQCILQFIPHIFIFLIQIIIHLVLTVLEFIDRIIKCFIMLRLTKYVIIFSILSLLMSKQIIQVSTAIIKSLFASIILASPQLQRLQISNKYEIMNYMVYDQNNSYIITKHQNVRDIARQSYIQQLNQHLKRSYQQYDVDDEDTLLGNQQYHVQVCNYQMCYMLTGQTSYLLDEDQKNKYQYKQRLSFLNSTKHTFIQMSDKDGRIIRLTTPIGTQFYLKQNQNYTDFQNLVIMIPEEQVEDYILLQLIQYTDKEENIIDISQLYGNMQTKIRILDQNDQPTIELFVIPYNIQVDYDQHILKNINQNLFSFNLQLPYHPGEQYQLKKMQILEQFIPTQIENENKDLESNQTSLIFEIGNNQQIEFYKALRQNQNTPTEVMFYYIPISQFVHKIIFSVNIGIFLWNIEQNLSIITRLSLIGLEISLLIVCQDQILTYLYEKSIINKIAIIILIENILRRQSLKAPYITAIAVFLFTEVVVRFILAILKNNQNDEKIQTIEDIYTLIQIVYSLLIMYVLTSVKQLRKFANRYFNAEIFTIDDQQQKLQTKPTRLQQWLLNICDYYNHYNLFVQEASKKQKRKLLNNLPDKKQDNFVVILDQNKKLVKDAFFTNNQAAKFNGICSNTQVQLFSQAQERLSIPTQNLNNVTLEYIKSKNELGIGSTLIDDVQPLSIKEWQVLYQQYLFYKKIKKINENTLTYAVHKNQINVTSVSSTLYINPKNTIPKISNFTLVYKRILSKQNQTFAQPNQLSYISPDDINQQLLIFSKIQLLGHLSKQQSIKQILSQHQLGSNILINALFKDFTFKQRQEITQANIYNYNNCYGQLVQYLVTDTGILCKQRNPPAASYVSDCFIPYLTPTELISLIQFCYYDTNSFRVDYKSQQNQQLFQQYLQTKTNNNYKELAQQIFQTDQDIFQMDQPLYVQNKQLLVDIIRYSPVYSSKFIKEKQQLNYSLFPKFCENNSEQLLIIGDLILTDEKFDKIYEQYELLFRLYINQKYTKNKIPEQVIILYQNIFAFLLLKIFNLTYTTIQLYIYRQQGNMLVEFKNQPNQTEHVFIPASKQFNSACLDCLTCQEKYIDTTRKLFVFTYQNFCKQCQGQIKQMFCAYSYNEAYNIQLVLEQIYSQFQNAIIPEDIVSIFSISGLYSRVYIVNTSIFEVQQLRTYAQINSNNKKDQTKYVSETTNQGFSWLQQQNYRILRPIQQGIALLHIQTYLARCKILNTTDIHVIDQFTNENIQIQIKIIQNKISKAYKPNYYKLSDETANQVNYDYILFE